MIRAMISNEGVTVMASGGTKELAAEVCALAGSMWSSMKKRDEDNAEAFRMMLKAALTDETSPVWKEDEYTGGLAIALMHEMEGEA